MCPLRTELEGSEELIHPSSCPMGKRDGSNPFRRAKTKCMSSPVASLPALKAIPVIFSVAGVTERWVLLVRHRASFLSKAKPGCGQIILRDSGWTGIFC